MLISYGHLYEADLIHPLEASTMQECQKNILFDWLAKNVADIKNRVSSYAQAVARDFPVTKETMPKLYSLYTTALQRLACEQEYPLFVHYGYDLTCQVAGSDENEYTIILNSECLEVLSDQELLALLGYQLGRIKAGHIQTLELISLMESGAKNLPVVGELVGKQLWAFFAEWMIVSQFTADRAALFACGSLKVVESLILKQMGSTPDKIEDLLQQKSKKPNNSLGIYYVWLSQSLPVFGGVERIKELRRWTSSQKFKEDYPMLFFNAAIDRGEKGDSATSRRLIDLHQRVYAGDVDAAVFQCCYRSGRKGRFGNVKATYRFASKGICW